MRRAAEDRRQPEWALVQGLIGSRMPSAASSAVADRVLAEHGSWDAVADLSVESLTAALKGVRFPNQSAKRVHGVLGAIRDTVDGAGVPLIVSNAGNDEATGEQCSPYITRISFSNAQVNRPMGKWMVDQGVKKVFTIAPDYAAGRQMIDAFTTAFTAAGGEDFRSGVPVDQGFIQAANRA